MKVIGQNSLSSIVWVFIKALWWLEWATLVAVLIYFSIAMSVRKVFVLNVPISYSTINIRQIYQLKRDAPFAIVNSSQGIFTSHISVTWGHCLYFLLAVLMIFAAVAVITYQLKVIMSDLKDNVPFSLKNTYRINVISVVLILSSLTQWIFSAVTCFLLKSKYNWRDISLQYDFDLKYLMMGLALLLIAGIVKIGVSLEEDSKLTI